MFGNNITSWLWYILEMGDPFKIIQIADKKFTSPNMSVSAVSSAIKTDADYLFIYFIFCHARSDMCVVMLGF